VNKHKIKPERCLPIMTVAHGCAVCMKTCPVQRYGLPAVLEHYRATETILGKGTDELESYHFSGRRYGVEEHPTMTAELLEPSGWTPIDRERTVPPQADTNLGLGGVV
jgi:hypothetical protein